MEKKAQLEIMQNAFILLTIIIIFAFVLVFVMMMNRSAQRDRLEEFRELELIKKSQVLNFLPEMQCSDNNNLDPDCYDLHKIIEFEKHVKDSAKNNLFFYQSLLGHLKISIKQYEISPDFSGLKQEWTVYDDPPKDDKGSKKVFFPVRIRDGVDDESYFGVVELWVYE